MRVTAVQSESQTVEANPSAAPVAVVAEVAQDPKNRRGPFRPETLSPVRKRLNGTTLARMFRSVDALVVMVSALAVAWAFGPVAG